MKMRFYEYDAVKDSGISLEVERGSGVADHFRFGITVDGEYRAAFVGYRDAKRLIEYLERELKRSR